MAHEWEPYGRYKTYPNEHDIVRTAECKQCLIRAAQVISTGEILGGILTYLPDCETVCVRIVLEA